LARQGSGRKSLKKYEIYNLLFFLGLILVLGTLVTFVFRSYSTRNESDSSDGARGIISEVVADGSDIGMFYLGTKIYETSGQYQSLMEVPVTDDGFLKELFSIPGVAGITVDRRSLMIRKYPSASWNTIRPAVRQIVERHLHLHY